MPHQPQTIAERATPEGHPPPPKFTAQAGPTVETLLAELLTESGGSGRISGAGISKMLRDGSMSISLFETVSPLALRPFCDPDLTHVVYREYGGSVLRLWAPTTPRVIIEAIERRERDDLVVIA